MVEIAVALMVEIAVALMVEIAVLCFMLQLDAV